MRSRRSTKPKSIWACRRVSPGNSPAPRRRFRIRSSTQPILILTALLAVYIVLGILYESLVHPLTIISTLPSAGLGALIALVLFQTELTIIALIGIILLIGIVKKNAIMMIDFALAAERNEGLTPREAIFQACLLRFRPIMMTTACALLGGLPLALGQRHGRGIAASAGHRDCGRADREPDADAVYDAGDLSVAGSAADPIQPAASGAASAGDSGARRHSGRLATATYRTVTVRERRGYRPKRVGCRFLMVAVQNQKPFPFPMRQ